MATKSNDQALGLQYSIEYKKGSNNQVADALSRHPAISVGEVLAITMGTPEWLQEIKEGYAIDLVTQQMLQQMKKPDNKIKHLVWDGDILRYKRRIWVGGNATMQNKILQSLHAGAIGGHSRVQAPLQWVRQLFTWSRMKLAVQ